MTYYGKTKNGLHSAITLGLEKNGGGIERLLIKNKMNYTVFKSRGGDRWYQPSEFSELFPVSYAVYPIPRSICVVSPYDFFRGSSESSWDTEEDVEYSKSDGVVGIGIGTTKDISLILEKVMEDLGVFIFNQKRISQTERKFQNELGQIRRKWGKR